MKDSLIKEIVDEYLNQENFRKREIENVEKQIQELSKKRQRIFCKNIYSLIYKLEYGDYHEYVEEVAKELRRRNSIQLKGCKK